MLTNHNIILFDGECNFCSFWVKFIIKRDKKDAFRFASLQSEVGKQFLTKFNISKNVDTVVFIQKDIVFVKSTAALTILKTLGGFWSLFYVLMIIPHFIRNFFYDLIAKYRYVFFRKNTCQLNNQNDIKHKFLY
ncbi:MAG: hypothetical protein CVT95_02375 [Bacteroidetes bacterium HGW-Bacteroidetes-12]|jgi:predicted DCC family thiol-disulfide oxidoreductase YuxK|nr:MAG: hypothetical protein CVT95_02375 [Bacteroidetes bacterium HGW-Bacteroidetes-12]